MINSSGGCLNNVLTPKGRATFKGSLVNVIVAFSKSIDYKIHVMNQRLREGTWVTLSSTLLSS